MELVYKIKGFNFYLIPKDEGFQILQTNETSSKYLKRGRIWLCKEFALYFLEKYISQETYLEENTHES
jgi:hypothetical protein